MDIFTVSEEVFGDFGVLTLTSAGGYTDMLEYDLSTEEFKLTVDRLVAKFIRVELED